MIFHINPMLVENFLKLERSETLPSNFTKKKFSDRKFRGKRFIGLVVKDRAIQVGKNLLACPHVKGTYERFTQGMDWSETEYYSWFKKKCAKSQKESRNEKVIKFNFEKFYKRRLRNWDNIFSDIQANGFKQSTSVEKNVEVALGADGKILLIDGRHRLIFAKILGIDSIPVVANLVSEQFATKSKDYADFFQSQLSHKKTKDRLELCLISKSVY